MILTAYNQKHNFLDSAFLVVTTVILGANAEQKSKYLANLISID